MKISAAMCAALCLNVGLGYLWYLADRVNMISTLCHVGLPNLSRPDVVESRMLGCAVLGPKVRVKGVLLTGSETARFMSDELGPAPASDRKAGTWYTPNQTRRFDKVDRELSKHIPGLCNTRLALLTVEGWPTVSAGTFGHLNSYSREFFEDKVLTVSPPPPALINRMRAEFAKSGLGEDKGYCDPRYG